MTRKKPEQDLVERGRKHKISESKRAILNHFGTQFYSVVPLGHVGKFYDAVVWWCIKHWGYRADLSVDLAGDELFTDTPPTLAAGSDDEEVDEDSEPSEEEIEMRNTYRTKLRQQLGQYMRRVFTHTPVVQSKEPVGEELESALSTLISSKSRKKPRKDCDIAHYMKLYYKDQMMDEGDRLVAEANKEWKKLTLTEEWKALSDEEKHKRKPGAAAIRWKLAQSFWATQPESFKKDVRASAETSYQEALEEYNQAKQVPKTASQYHHQIQSGTSVVRPIADGIAQKFGCPVIILMPMPIPASNGQIQVLSVHAHKPGGLEHDTWFSHDAAKYKDAETSLAAWAVTQFSIEEVARRTLSQEAIDAIAAMESSTPPQPSAMPSPHLAPAADPVVPQEAQVAVAAMESLPPPQLPAMPSPHLAPAADPVVPQETQAAIAAMGSLPPPQPSATSSPHQAPAANPVVPPPEQTEDSPTFHTHPLPESLTLSESPATPVRFSRTPRASVTPGPPTPGHVELSPEPEFSGVTRHWPIRPQTPARDTPERDESGSPEGHLIDRWPIRLSESPAREDADAEIIEEDSAGAEDWQAEVMNQEPINLNEITEPIVNGRKRKLDKVSSPPKKRVTRSSLVPRRSARSRR